MYTKEDQNKLRELMNTNDDFAYFITQTNENCKFITSRISHELRNPLTLIKSTAQLIESNHPEVKDFKHWAQLMEDINGLADLLAELSSYNNSQIVSKKQGDLLQVIKSVINAYSAEAEQKEIKLSLSIAEDNVPYFTNYTFDKIKFKQVITNLIRNAFEATKKGDYINVECNISPSNLTIAVHDNGKCISSDELPTIFEPFVTYKTGGSGLGLAICSNIIAAHNGTIQAFSAKDKTSFLITLQMISTP